MIQEPPGVRPLTDAFGRAHTYLRLSLTDRCNFRCVYCMPAEGVEWTPRAEILSFEEIERLVALFAGMGVTKVRLTGGEPTVRKGFLELAQRLARVHGVRELHLTTNGSRLAELAAPLARLGLAGVNISLDSLQRERFIQIARRDGLDQVVAGIDAALAQGLPTKLNMVVMPGVNDDEVPDFVELTREWPIQVRFIEFMPFARNGWDRQKVLSSAELRRRLTESVHLVPLDSGLSAVAREYAVPGHAGTVGFVSSVTESFCAGCNRLRLTADGQFKTCLFLPSCLDLRGMVRSGAKDEELERAVRSALLGKWPGHPTMNDWQQRDPLSMVQIGG